MAGLPHFFYPVIKTGEHMESEDIRNLPTRWAALMQKYGISKRSVAKKAGVNIPHFYDVLNKKGSPTLDYAFKIEEVLNDIIIRKNSVVVPELQATESIELAACRKGDDHEISRNTQQRINQQLS